MPTAETAELPLADLTTRLEQARRDMGARTVMATDGSANLMGVVPTESQPEASVLAALGAANLAATSEIVRRMDERAADPRMVIVEYPGGHVLLSAGRSQIVFIAVLGADSPLGLARVEMARLADIVWKDDRPKEDEDPSEEISRGLLSSLDQQI